MISFNFHYIFHIIENAANCRLHNSLTYFAEIIYFTKSNPSYSGIRMPIDSKPEYQVIFALVMLTPSGERKYESLFTIFLAKSEPVFHIYVFIWICKYLHSSRLSVMWTRLQSTSCARSVSDKNWKRHHLFCYYCLSVSWAAKSGYRLNSASADITMRKLVLSRIEDKSQLFTPAAC